MQGVALTLEKVIHEACSNIDGIPDDIIIAFSPSISIHDSTTSQYLRADGESPISMNEIDTMIEKIESASLLRAREKARREHGLTHDDIRLISSTLTSIHIDGKRVTNPIGFRGSELRITVLNVFALASEYNILRSIVSSLKKDIISLVPMPLLFPKVIENTERA
jgi:cell division protein FtsA